VRRLNGKPPPKAALLANMTRRILERALSSESPKAA
jgi:hypothetical protein